jgi:hypothetical protein
MLGPAGMPRKILGPWESKDSENQLQDSNFVGEKLRKRDGMFASLFVFVTKIFLGMKLLRTVYSLNHAQVSS